MPAEGRRREGGEGGGGRVRFMRSTLPREPGFDFLLEGRRSLPVAPGAQGSLASLHESTAARPRMLYYRVYVDTTTATTTNSGEGQRKEGELRDGTGKERTSYETEDLEEEEEGRKEGRKEGRGTETPVPDSNLHPPTWPFGIWAGRFFGGVRACSSAPDVGSLGWVAWTRAGHTYLGVISGW
ncbi:hypothetical protein FA13DRAFT_1717523 [Coprinellus micaceus]|uniref:Uncharacterized protein n=1 Tax=Coprinellus micaceus TaxID=71717 RepID=A0A4Y7SFX1_COPMI|nr:hypothetical protein FA13DRAFT_1717523 [Coprinellus micaceus]